MKTRTQRRKIIGFNAVIFCTVYFGIAGSAMAFDAAQTFTKKCSSCHTVGEGDSIGPDLKDVTTRRNEAWLLRFILSSEGMIVSGDAIAVELYNKFNKKNMPDQDFSESEIKAILHFIQSGGIGATPMDAKSALDATPQDIQIGEDLFVGRRSLAGGGVACISCHSAGDVGLLGGGTMALNLTSAYSTYKDKGLSKSLKNIAFPVMQQIFADHPLTDDEIFQIKAFLYKSDQAGITNTSYQKKFIFLGIGGMVLALGVIDFIWRRRRKHAVKNFRGGRS